MANLAACYCYRGQLSLRGISHSRSLGEGELGAVSGRMAVGQFVTGCSQKCHAVCAFWVFLWSGSVAFVETCSRQSCRALGAPVDRL